MANSYDALLLLSFGGPECRDDVIPYLENVLRGKNVPRERMLEVAEHYYHFDGVSPINQQNRQLLEAMRQDLAAHGLSLPVYWGNRNWQPYLADTLRQMGQEGVRNALAIVTSAFSSYSGCRQYREDLLRARAEVGPAAPHVAKIRPFFNHPGLIETWSERVRDALRQVPPERLSGTHLVYTAHSIPLAMAKGCEYERQLLELCRLVSRQVGHERTTLAYQSRSGPPSQPWLEPDIRDHLQQLRDQGDVTDVVIVPIGFMSDHMEVLYDLDYEAQQCCDALGLRMIRAATPGVHPRFVAMIRELVCERLTGVEPLSCGDLPPCPHDCPETCCPSGRPPTPGR
jgi:ferrochelatase